MNKLKTFLYFLLALTSVNTVFGQDTGIKNNYNTDSGLTHLSIERSFVYKPERAWLYSHHPYITFFKNKFITSWSNGIKDEDAPGQRVMFSVSDNFKDWSAPIILSEPGNFTDSQKNVLTAAGFHQYGDTLVAYYGEYSPKRTNTKLWAKTTTDGIHWSASVDMHVPVNPNLGPSKLKSGRLVICGNFSFCYTDDPKGLAGWKMTSFYPSELYKEDNPSTFYSPAEKTGLPPLCEASFFQTADEVIHALLRVTGKGWKGKLWLTESITHGESWSRPMETAFTDNDSKFHFGRLPNNYFYYVGIPDTIHHYERNPLVLALSKDGKKFDQQYIIANSLYKLKQEGLWKGGQYGYPYTIIEGAYMYVIISRQKEAIEIIRFKLDQVINK